MEGIFSIKSDVYSFGILMLEIVSGRRNNSFYNENSSLNVVGHAWELWKDGAALELVDEGIKGSLVQDQALRCIHVALLCAEERAVDRPTMAEILSMLTNQSSKLPLPKRPALCFLNNSSVNDKENTNSSYHLTSLILSLGIKVTEKKKERH
ncbi:putative cysteine-rich receptor-like protein kinase 35 [Neltuma alba]|uniref:putative cysteine-rich receptor-like protein kinase 35 n=1 Tax=Neltuma alba TaxID=207710 RepID=UPI0010A3EFE6|nr:putative cysteine-rich receptor-like protein kinase 35 [Prosopis alba]